MKKLILFASLSISSLLFAMEESSVEPTQKLSLLKAVRAGNLEEVKKLILQRADLEQIDGAGNTPLILAAIMGHVRITASLINAGANIHAKNLTHEDTAFDIAQMLMNPEHECSDPKCPEETKKRFLIHQMLSFKRMTSRARPLQPVYFELWIPQSHKGPEQCKECDLEIAIIDQQST